MLGIVCLSDLWILLYSHPADRANIAATKCTNSKQSGECPLSYYNINDLSLLILVIKHNYSEFTMEVFRYNSRITLVPMQENMRFY